MASIFGRQVILVLTNKSGGSVIAGDVVIVDTSNDTAFTTTTSAAYTGGVGVAQETIANNATGRVLISGYAALVNVNASVTRGQYGTTHTVAKQATGTASRGAGTFAQWLTGGTTPTARIFAPDLAAAAGNIATDAIWDAKGDLALGTGADTASKLTVGADDTILMADSAQSTGVKWVASQTPSTQAFGDAAAQGTADTYARGDHKHAMPAASAAGWTQVINEDGTSFANWTADAGGTWSSDGTVIKQTNTSATARRARYNTAIVVPYMVADVDIQLRSSGTDRIGGFLMGFDAATANGFLARLNQSGTAQFERDGSTDSSSTGTTTTVTVNTWYTLRIVKAGSVMTAYKDGTLLVSVTLSTTAAKTPYFGLYTYQAEVWFRNIKVWVPTLP